MRDWIGTRLCCEGRRWRENKMVGTKIGRGLGKED